MPCAVLPCCAALPSFRVLQRLASTDQEKHAAQGSHPTFLTPLHSYSLAYAWTVWRTFQTILKLPYNSMRRANLVVRIQVGRVAAGMGRYAARGGRWLGRGRVGF